jgi:hypothetical protein
MDVRFMTSSSDVRHRAECGHRIAAGVCLTADVSGGRLREMSIEGRAIIGARRSSYNCFFDFCFFDFFSGVGSPPMMTFFFP